MKLTKIKNIVFPILILQLVYNQPLSAQGYGGPLNVQGLDNRAMHSAAMRAFGGVTIGIHNEIGLMFHNPAALQTIDGVRLSVAGMQQSKSMRQEQHFAPVRHYPNLSVLLEGKTYRIPDPDSTLFGESPRDTVQRPYDDIQPNWSRSNSEYVPIQALLAVPFTVANVRFVAGAGVVQYADLNHYYQHNNVLSPPVLSQRPYPTLRPTDANPIDVDWYQRVRSREGSLYGYGFALSSFMEKYNISLGISGLLIDGKTDDFEQQVTRGKLTFYSNAFRVDSVYRVETRTGTSNFSGREFSVGAIYHGENISVGFTVTPPTSIKRTFSTRESIDTTGSPVLMTYNGEDKLRLPWRGSVGFSISPRDNLRLGLEFDIRPYDSAEYTDHEGNVSNPWLSSSVFKIGVEYGLTPWLMIRGGMRGAAEVFEPEGNPIEGDPVTYTIYSAGVGLNIAGFVLNVAYESSTMRYEDIWGSALSKNRERRSTIVADISYRLPWVR